MTPMNWGLLVVRRGCPCGSREPPFTNLRAYSFMARATGVHLRECPQHVSSFFTRKLEVTVSGGSTFARVKLKEIDGMAPQDVERAV